MQRREKKQKTAPLMSINLVLSQPVFGFGFSGQKLSRRPRLNHPLQDQLQNHESSQEWTGTGRVSVFKVVFKGDDVDSTHWKWITVKTEKLNGCVQQSCGSDLYAGHIPPISVFLPRLYCFPGNQPQIRTRIKHLSDPQQGRQMGERTE